MAILGCELVSNQIKFRNRIRDNRLAMSRNVQAIVVNSIDAEAVHARAGAADGAAFTQYTSALASGARCQQSKTEWRSVERGIRKFCNLFCIEIVADLRSGGLNQVCSRGDFDSSRSTADY